MAEALVSSMATNFDPTHFRDEFQAALQEMLQAKMEGHAVAAPAAKSEAPAVTGSDGGAARIGRERKGGEDAS